MKSIMQVFPFFLLTFHLNLLQSAFYVSVGGKQGTGTDPVSGASGRGRGAVPQGDFFPQRRGGWGGSGEVWGGAL